MLIPQLIYSINFFLADCVTKDWRKLPKMSVDQTLIKHWRASSWKTLLLSPILLPPRLLMIRSISECRHVIFQIMRAAVPNSLLLLIYCIVTAKAPINYVFEITLENLQDIQSGYVTLQVVFAFFFKKLKPFSHKLNSKITVQFCYLRLYLGTETIFCRLLQRMARIDMEEVGPEFSSFNAMPAKIT